MPSHSIVIVNWNGRDLLAECLPSLRAQTLPGEVVMVDNGSADGSVDFVRASFPEVVVEPLDRNHGFAVANNVGMRLARGEYVALLNNDTVVDPRWAAELARGLDEHADVGFCASKMLQYGQKDVIDTAGDELGVARAYKRGTGQPDGPEFAEPRYVFGACAGAAMYRRRMLDDIGLFDESFVTNFEDVDLSFRAQLAGYRCLYVPTAVVHHKVAATKRRTGWSAQMAYRNSRNSKLMWLKNAPMGLLGKYALPILAQEGRQLRRSVKKADWATVRSLLAADAEIVRLLPTILRKRRGIQRRRVVTPAYIESLMRV